MNICGSYYELLSFIVWTSTIPYVHTMDLWCSYYEHGLRSYYGPCFIVWTKSFIVWRSTQVHSMNHVSNYERCIFILWTQCVHTMNVVCSYYERGVSILWTSYIDSMNSNAFIVWTYLRSYYELIESIVCTAGTLLQYTTVVLHK